MNPDDNLQGAQNAPQNTPEQQLEQPSAALSQEQLTVGQKKPLIKRPIAIAIVAIVAVIILVIGFLYYLYSSSKSEGLEKTDGFITLLEENDSEALKEEVYEMLGVDDQTNDPQALEEITRISIETSYASSVLQSTDAERYSDHFGTTTDGSELVTAYYKFTINDTDTGYYAISAKKVDGGWTLNSADFTTVDPLN